MAVVFPLDLAGDEFDAADLDAAAVATPAVAIHHVLDCLAGFFRSESDALQAMDDLVHNEGLSRSQLLLLGPDATAWLPLRRRTRQWASGPHAQAQPWRTDTWTVASLGGLIVGLICVGVFRFDDNMTPLALLFVLTLAVGAGAACGTVWSGSLTLPPRHRKFDSVVRRQLAGGRWVVLAQDVPWTRQAAIVHRVRELSLNWSAVSSGARWK